MGEAPTATAKSTPGRDEIQLDVSNMEVVYHDIVQVLRGISLTVRRGQIVALLGTNGAGKTTTLRAISGLLKSDNGHVAEGSIRFENREIQDWSAPRIVRAGMVQVLEGRRIFPHLTVEENLRVGSIIRSAGREVREDTEGIYEMFPGLYALRHRVAGYTSGGEQQMLAIGRALMARPRLLLLDEPSLGLAPRLVMEIFEKIEAINRAGTTVLLVEQNANVGLDLADYGYVMEQGRIVLEGTTQQLRENPDIREFYMGLTKSGDRRSFKSVKAYKRRRRWM